ncbi:MAG: SEC-C domain-containing protein [Deltaproteobacteria bacterium]|nr:SEC-C domain-containing protein [Deltaproteobacteria bacterium]
MDPSCGCDEVTIQFFDTLAVGGRKPSLGYVSASVRRLRSPSIHGPAVLRQLWVELLDQLGAQLLRDRFKRMRQAVLAPQTPARKALCPCGSGKKY